MNITQLKSSINTLNPNDLLIESTILNYLEGVKYALKHSNNVKQSTIYDSFNIAYLNNNYEIIKLLFSFELNKDTLNSMIMPLSLNDTILDIIIKDSANIDANLITDEKTKELIENKLREIKLNKLLN